MCDSRRRLPWTPDAPGVAVWDTLQLLLGRHDSDNFLFVYLVLVNQYVTTVPMVGAVTLVRMPARVRDGSCLAWAVNVTDARRTHARRAYTWRTRVRIASSLHTERSGRVGDVQDALSCGGHVGSARVACVWLVLVLVLCSDSSCCSSSRSYMALPNGIFLIRKLSNALPACKPWSRWRTPPRALTWDRSSA